ncbi:MAG: hypothetical protein ABIA37_03995 [Candidatus Woesearchaeota archaeon]
MNDRNQQAREDFRMKMMQQMMQQQGGMMNPAMMQGEMPPQKELTPEEKAEMEKQRKEQESKNRKNRIESLQKSLRQKKAELNVLEKYLGRVAANKNILINVDLKEAETEWHKKATQAEIEELEAVIEENEISLESEKENHIKMEKELQELLEKEEEEKIAKVLGKTEEKVSTSEEKTEEKTE